MSDITSPVQDLRDGAQDLRGRGALVTGASRGIGLAIATELLGRGASVTITARKPDELAAAAEELVADAAGGDARRVLAVPGNAGSAQARAEAVARTVSPVIQDAASETRNATSDATSCGSPSRFIG